MSSIPVAEIVFTRWWRHRLTGDTRRLKVVSVPARRARPRHLKRRVLRSRFIRHYCSPLPLARVHAAYYSGMAMVDVTLPDGTVVTVPYPWVPPAPAIGNRRRKELARHWLISLSQAPSPERIEALAPLVGQFNPRSPLGKMASQFVSKNRLPVIEDVITAHLHRQAVRRRPVIAAATMSPASKARLLEVIDEHWAQHGQGPAWSQLSKEVGLDRQQVAVVLRTLERDGAVTYTGDTGSLRRADPASSPAETHP